MANDTYERATELVFNAPQEEYKQNNIVKELFPSYASHVTPAPILRSVQVTGPVTLPVSVSLPVIVPVTLPKKQSSRQIKRKLRRFFRFLCGKITVVRLIHFLQTYTNCIAYCQRRTNWSSREC